MGLTRGRLCEPTPGLQWSGRSGGESFNQEEDYLAGCLNWHAVGAGQQLATIGA
jgi:hypothetical protein